MKATPADQGIQGSREDAQAAGKARRVVARGSRVEMETEASHLRAFGNYAIARYRSGLGWHVTVTPWA